MVWCLSVYSPFCLQECAHLVSTKAVCGLDVAGGVMRTRRPRSNLSTQITTFGCFGYLDGHRADRHTVVSTPNTQKKRFRSSPGQDTGHDIC